MAERCSITAMPTFQFYKGGTRVAELCGADEGQLRALIVQHGQPDATASTKMQCADSDSRKREATASTEAVDAPPGGGKRLKRDSQPVPPVIDPATKPIKWKKIIARELKSCGGQMRLKALRKACVSEVRAWRHETTAPQVTDRGSTGAWTEGAIPRS